MLRTFSRVVPCASDLVAEACNQLPKNNKKLINPSETQLQIKVICFVLGHHSFHTSD
jgi:hypothetical protein